MIRETHKKYRHICDLATYNHPLFNKALEKALNAIDEYPCNISNISIKTMCCEWCDNSATVAYISLKEKDDVPEFIRRWCNLNGVLIIHLEGVHLFAQSDWFSCGCDD